MTENEELTSAEFQNFKSKVLLLGAILGAVTGLGAAYLLVQRVESDEQLKLTPGEGVKLGISIFAFLRQVMQLGDKSEK
jgi:hypothetical protein